jgi:hypothetical protein
VLRRSLLQVVNLASHRVVRSSVPGHDAHLGLADAQMWVSANDGLRVGAGRRASDGGHIGLNLDVLHDFIDSARSGKWDVPMGISRCMGALNRLLRACWPGAGSSIGSWRAEPPMPCDLTAPSMWRDNAPRAPQAGPFVESSTDQIAEVSKRLC